MSVEGIEGEETEEWGVRKENEEKRTGGGGGTVEPEPSQARWGWGGGRSGRACQEGREGFALGPGAQVVSPVLEALAGIALLRGWCHKWEVAT